MKIILPYSLILAGIGLIESLLTLILVDELTETRGSGNKECVAQGAANIVTGFFGGMGGCAMIGQSIINVSSGARTRLSGITSATLFQEKFDPTNDPIEVIVDFKDSKIADHSGIEAVQKLTERYAKLNKKIRLRHLSEDCRRLIKRAGNMVEVDIIESEDPHYFVATDNLHPN